MGYFPSAAAQLKPYQNQYDPLQEYGKALQIRQLMQQGPLQQQALQQENQMRATQMQRDQATQALFQQASQSQKEPSDDEILAAAGPAQGAAILKSRQEYREVDAKIKELQDKHQQAAVDHIGSLAYAIQQNNYDPQKADTILSAAAAEPGFGPQVQQLRSQIQQNPALLKQVVDNAIAMSSKQREVGAQELAAQARMAQATKQQEPDKPLSPDDVQRLNQMGVPVKPGDTNKDAQLLQSGLNAQSSRENAQATREATAAQRGITNELARERLSQTENKVDSGAKAQALKLYEPALGADFRLSSMEESLPKALKGDQQAMVNILTNHIGMTLGLQKGARITKDILHEAQASAPWLQRIESHFDSDGYLTGVTLTPEQMHQMVDLGHTQRDLAWKQARSGANYIGVTDEPKSTYAPQTKPVSIPGAPPAPKDDGKILKQNGRPVAKSQGGQWVALQ